MKRIKLTTITSAAASAAALAFGSVLLGASPTNADQGNSERGTAAYGSLSPDPQSGPSSAGGAQLGAKHASGLQVANKSDANCTADNFDDAKVRSNDGKDVGQIRDFLIDPRGGTIRYAVVSSGGWAGIGDTLRLVPFTALKSANRDTHDKTAFRVALSKSKWQSLPSLAEDKFEQGRVKLTQEEQQQIARTFSTESARADSGTELLRASKIRGLDVTADNQDIGSVEGVLIRPGDENALALLDPNNDFVGGSQKYLVPVADLQMSGNGNARTTLSKQDFRSAAPSNESTAMNASSAATASEAHKGTANSDHVRVLMPTPTGFSSADQTPTTSQQLIDGAQAIRRALDRDNSLARQNVTIVPENGKITLRGSVASDDLKAKVEDTANKAGEPNVVISDLKVQQR